MSRLIGWIGGLLTAGYLALLAYLVEDRLETLVTMELNEVGDFLAGAFGPLAILWLILGFFQQGIELRQNSEALRSQAAELERSVVQQTKLVNIAQDQLLDQRAAMQQEVSSRTAAADTQKRRAQPFIRFLMIGHSGQPPTKSYALVIKNDGAQTCTSVHVRFYRPEMVDMHIEKLTRGEPVERNLHVRFGDATEVRMNISISFSDGLGEYETQSFYGIFYHDSATIVPTAGHSMTDLL